MKKIAFLLSSLLTLSLCGCSKDDLPFIDRELPKKSELVVLILDKNNNSNNIIPTSITSADKIKEIYNSIGNLCIVVSDGNPSVTIKKSGKALQPVRIYRHSLLSYNGSGNWTDEALLGHHARYIDSHPRFHYRIRFEQVGLLETTRSCHQTDWIGNETSVE